MDAVLVPVGHGLGVAVGIAHGRHHDVAALGQLACGRRAEAARATGDEHHVLAAPVMGGRRRRVGVQRGPPPAERAAATQLLPLLVGHRRADRDLVDGVVADRPSHRQRLLQVDDVGQRRGHAGRSGTGGGQGPESVQPGRDQVPIGVGISAVGNGQIGRLPVAGEHAGLDRADLHTQCPDLEPQSFGQRFQGELGGRVVSQQWGHDPA